MIGEFGLGSIWNALDSLGTFRPDSESYSEANVWDLNSVLCEFGRSKRVPGSAGS